MDAHPKTFAEFSRLHPHQALDIPMDQRQAFDDLTWENYTAPAYNHQRSLDAVGEWVIGHQQDPRSDGSFEPVELKYKLPLPDDLTFIDVLEKRKELADGDSVEEKRLWAMTTHQEIGYVFDQGYARRFVDLARRSDGQGDPAEKLKAAGFKEEEALDAHGEVTRRFRKPDDKRGFFSVFLADTYLQLMHEKRGATSWTNLLRVKLGSTSYDKEKWLPVFWSPEVASPLTAAAEMAAVMAREWKPTVRKSPARKGPA